MPAVPGGVWGQQLLVASATAVPDRHRQKIPSSLVLANLLPADPAKARTLLPFPGPGFFHTAGALAGLGV
jgi:hypothetical protein